MSIIRNNHYGELYKGEVIFYNEAKRYGFIKGADGKELFFHRADIINDDGEPIPKGERVGYGMLKINTKGYSAKEVHLFRD